MSELERRLEQMGVGDDQGWDWFDPDEASAPERDTDPETARKHLDDPDWLREQYLEKARPKPEIADEIGVSVGAIKNAIARHGLRRERHLYRDGAKFARRYDEAELLEILRTAAAEYNGQLSIVKYRRWRRHEDSACPSAETIQDRLGSWTDAKALALDSEEDQP